MLQQKTLMIRKTKSTNHNDNNNRILIREPEIVNHRIYKSRAKLPTDQEINYR